MSGRDYLLFAGILLGCGTVLYTYACNEAVCASLVSKCMLLKYCECNMLDKSNCTCCKDCHKCLAKLYTECCSCVGMCENRNPKYNSLKMSSVEELDNPIVDLFRVLTDEPDDLLRWTTYTYPAHLDLLYFKPRGTADFGLNAASALGENQQHQVRHKHSHVIIDPDTDAQNCTVAYMTNCMSVNKCRQSCDSMGAARFRWFHEFGCCECIGSTCLDFGKGEALCLRCSAETVGQPHEEEIAEQIPNLDTEENTATDNDNDEVTRNDAAAPTNQESNALHMDGKVSANDENSLN